MTRETPKHYDSPGHADLLTFSCYRRQGLFEDVSHCRLFCRQLAKVKISSRFDLWGYVIMPEHVHLLIWPREEHYQIASILQAIKQPVARRVLAILRRTGSDTLNLLATGQSKNPYRFWQAGGGHDKNLYTPKLIAAELDYIHKNPIRRKLVRNPCDWLWSSASNWILNKEGPVTVDMESFPMQR